MADQDLKAKFHERMLELYRRAAEETGYRPTYFLQMVVEKGGIEAAHSLLHSPKPAEGLTKLWELGRLDLSVEATLVEEPVWQPLFSEEEIAIARKRLRDFGYTPGVRPA